MTATSRVWYPRMGSVGACNTIASVVAGTSLYTQVTGGTAYLDITSFVLKLSPKDADMDVAPINTLGTTQKVDEKRPSMRVADVDLLYSDASKALIARLAGVAESSPPTGFTRYRLGEKSTVANHRALCALTWQFSDGTNIENHLMNNAYMTKFDGPDMSGEDYAKATIQFKCLAGDYYAEDNLADS